jgi:hypothetical protein
VLTPGLADLFDAIVVIRDAAHSVKILRNKRMVIARQGKPIHVDGSFVTGISPQRDSDLAIDGTIV